MSDSDTRTPRPQFYAHLEAQRLRTIANSLRSTADILELPDTLEAITNDDLPELQELRSILLNARTKIARLADEINSRRVPIIEVFADPSLDSSYVDDPNCDFDYKTATLDAGTYCRYHRAYHFGV